MRRVTLAELADDDLRIHQSAGAAFPSDYEYLEISKKDCLYVRAHGCGDDERFAGLFAEVWKEIPSDYQCEMIKWWNGHPDFQNLGIPVYLVPQIELRNDWPADCGNDADEPGVCRTGGLHLLFRPQILDDMPCEMVKLIIAHELAHVWQSAIAIEAYSVDKCVPPLESCKVKWPNDVPCEIFKIRNQNDLRECSAHTIAISRWKFQADCPNRWISKYSHQSDTCIFCTDQRPCVIQYLCETASAGGGA